MGEVTIRRVSSNAQNKTFHTSYLPARFMAHHYDPVLRKRHPEKQPWTFLDRHNEVADLPIQTPGRMTLDSSNPIDLHNIKSAKAYMHGHNQIKIEIDDFDEIAETKALDRTKRIEALMALEAYKEVPGFYVSLARRLGMGDPEIAARPVVVNYVQERCEVEPNVVLDILASAHRDELFELDKAIKNQFISYNSQEGIYRYGQVVMGANEGAVLDFFRSKHPEIYADIRHRNAEVSSIQMNDENAQKLREHLPPPTPSINQISAQALSKDERSRVEQLVKEGVKALLVVDNNDTFHYANIPLSVPSGNGDRLSRAVDFLSIPENKGLLTQLTKAIVTQQSLQD